MKVVQRDFCVSTHRRNEMIDITAQVQSIVRDSEIANGQVVVFCPHTTAAITINENADPAVPHDILLTLKELLPHDRAGYRHSEGNSDAHCASSLVGASELLLLYDGRLTLGSWQGIFFCEFDGPRNRKVVVQVCGE
ncbi:MAG TPA: secondary thiamine-phosphate synthase enzyme YjbQ [Sedimentisphaerales bacterium]|nr:secondary thiamine-phosphate synthase enzyme YjbQ [Sedimentisphaerales bacterium]HRS11689.1 secondary thiamine-phosphate synthase enzyme YjbQ [Sedimentisphaerales bacterium]HRV48352.1 secondary thiamine-phosphate synthase enzyme YjbQ [Sedimentisphaerales bacterium]